MKTKIRFVDSVSNPGKTVVKETEVNLRNLDHFNVQRNTRANIFVKKKGKGSFKRKDKYGREDY